MASPPGVGKTTLLRDIAAELGESFTKRVVIIDTSEIYIEGNV
ncbi:MAG: AAA family ATPase [Eubacteriales bacterium]